MINSTIFAALTLSSVTSHNTHTWLLTSFWPIPAPSNHLHHLHMTSKTPRTKFPCSNLVIINFQPWTLFIVKSGLCLSLTLPPCALYSCILCLAVFLVHTLFTPTLAPITITHQFSMELLTTSNSVLIPYLNTDTPFIYGFPSFTIWTSFEQPSLHCHQSTCPT